MQMKKREKQLRASYCKTGTELDPKGNQGLNWHRGRATQGWDIHVTYTMWEKSIRD